ncbi:MAG: glycoside hydrolase family 43 protein [Clostridia bacterium]|nr:glycoside hydrolase family 43 protein [Clostridia bacterium]
MSTTVISFFTAIILFITSVFSAVIPQKAPTEPAGEAEEHTMPLGGGADPWFYEHDGRYYYCYSLGNGVGVKSADSLAALWDAEGRRVYTAPAGTMYSADYWAPELHFIDGRWYIYVAADDGANENHRMYVLSCDAPDGDFVMEGKISDSVDKWAIDGTVLQYNGELWFIWSGWIGDENGRQDLFIAHMDSPTHIDGERVLISEATRKWEVNGMPINEGPEILYHEGRVFLVFSASGSWTNEYCLGIMTLVGDPGSRAGWIKNPVAVFTQQETAYGPGHCSFVTSGGVDYIVYHANVESGTGWGGRSVRVQPISYVCGAPVFGKPLPAGSIVKF